MTVSPAPDRRLVILGVAESDAHAVANQLIAMQLREHGFEVINLGVCTPLTEFAAAFERHPEAEAILVGTLNGHAHQDLRELPALRSTGLMACPVIVGGNFSVGARRDERDRARLLDLGVDHLLDDTSGLVLLLDMLRSTRKLAFQHG
ncbi:cobalamin-dependent protein [Actinokineospora globicatena]|uniref:Methylaspartate mutase n=1 Tax=Actinokineospora globicatena TaxID=103729 RepID=A0A9W6QI38_9PSEU|nr:cobalamin-dependent protein [Actinokineospora globicatena]GLW89862.1 methylaspartate mutase [Actinokineospora globicatena]